MLEREIPIPGLSIERDGNITRISKETGTFTVFYGHHLFPMNPELFPSNLSALFLESFNDASNFYSSWIYSPERVVETFKNFRQTAPLFPMLEGNRTKVVLGDLPLYLFYEGQVFLNMFPTVVEAGAGIGLAYGGVDNLLRTKMTRRQFLKGLFNMTAAAWLVIPVGSQLINGASYFLGKTGLSVDALELSRITHPEALFLIDLRNLVIAHKMDWLLKEVYRGGNIGLVIGALHAGIENWLIKSPEERISYLERTKPIWKGLVEPTTFFTAAEVSFDGSSWKMSNGYQIPDLQEVLTAD